METHLDKNFYVPDLEEFHVGFEYEAQGVITQNGPVWHKKTWNGSNRNNSTFNCVKDGTIRVKHLDREDIESFGFTLQSEGNNLADYHLLEDSHVYLTHLVKRNQIIIQVRIDGMLERDINSLNCKNKSEFKRILKQVGVI